MIGSKEYPYLFFTNVNRGVNPFLMKDEELWDSVNFWTERTMGAKKVRPGLKVFLDNQDNVPVTGLFYYKFPNQRIRLLRVSGSHLYAVDPTTALDWGLVQFTNPTTNAFVRPDFTELKATGHLVSQISSSESHYVEWTNNAGTDIFTDTNYTSNTDIVIPYKGSTITTYHQRVYVGSSYYAPNLYRSRLSWSVISYGLFGVQPASPWTTDQTGIDITSANYRDIDLDFNGGIIKVTNINDRINIYKEGGIYRYNETQVFSIFGLSPLQGTIATMPETEEDYWLTNEGFFKTDGNSVTPISDGWYPIIKQIFHNGLTPSKFNAFAINFLYFCYLGNIQYDGQILANAMFIYNAKFGELSLHSFGVDVSAMGYYINASKEKVIIFGDSSGNTYTFDYTANDDAGIPILAYFKTKYFFFDSVTNKNNTDQITGFATLGSALNVQADTDYKNEYKENVLELVGVQSKQKLDMSRLGQFSTISYRITWNGKGDRPEFTGIVPRIVQSSERMPQRKR